jgi:hypothetical protein
MFRNIRAKSPVLMSKEKRDMWREAIAWLWFFFLLSILAVVLAVLLSRHRKQQMLHQERMAALEKGTAIPLGPTPAPWSSRGYLLRGLIWSLTGAALVICLFGISMSSQRPESTQAKAWRAQSVARSLDIPLDQAKQMVEKDAAAEVHGMPAAVALLGLIPLSVGLAYLVFYYSDESRKLGAGSS